MRQDDEIALMDVGAEASLQVARTSWCRCRSKARHSISPPRRSAWRSASAALFSRHGVCRLVSPRAAADCRS